MKKNLRYAILLLILLFVAVNEAVLEMRSTSWERPLIVHIYAVSGDSRAASEAYVDSLTTRAFQADRNFHESRGAKRYGITMDAIKVEYHGRLVVAPTATAIGTECAGKHLVEPAFQGLGLASRMD